MCPPAKIITINAAPIASGAMTPAGAPIPVQPIVRTRKKVPMNSAMYLFITWMLNGDAKGEKTFLRRSELEKTNQEHTEHSREESHARPKVDSMCCHRAPVFAQMLGEKHRDDVEQSQREKQIKCVLHGHGVTDGAHLVVHGIEQDHAS